MIQPKEKGSSAKFSLPTLSYQNSEATCKIRIEQIDGPICKMTPEGHMDRVSVTESLKLLAKIFPQNQEDNPYKDIHLILDEMQILTASAEVKKYLYEGLRRHCHAGNVSQIAIVAPNPFVRIWARGKYLFRKSTNPTFHRTYAEALAKVRAVLYGNHNFHSQREELLKKAGKASSKELFRMYEQLLDENLNIKAHQQQRISELYEIAGRLTWDETFKPQPIAIEEEDSFSNVFNAFSLLQEDVYEMIRELKSLNLDLETQIVEGTRELAEKEAKLSSLIENTSDLLLSIDRGCNVLVINSPCKNYFATVYQKEVSAGTNLREIFPEKELAYWMERFKRVFKGEAFKEIKHDWVNHYEVIWEISFNPIRGGKGKVIGASVFCKDITIQKKVADKIAENEQLLDNIYNTAAIGIALIEENGHFVRVNKTYCSMYGYEEEELIGQSITLVVPPAERALVRESYEELMKTGKYVPAIRKDVCKNGMFVDVLVTASRYTGEGGKVFGVSTVVDITEKQRAEEVIRENQKALSDAHKIARLGSWEFNIHTGEISFSQESLNIMGAETDEECYKMTLEEFVAKLVHPDDVVLIKRHLKKAMRNQGQPNYRDSMEYRLVKQDGKVFNIVSYLRFKDHKKGIIYGVSQDITDRKKVIEKLRKQNRELKKVNSELDRFVYSVSHDLRAPLTSVLGLIQVIRQETEISKIMHLLELQEKSINRLDHFIKDIIDLSKNSRIEVISEEIHFREMIQNIFEEQSFNKNADKIEKHIEIEQTVPFFSDARRLSVIFNNLISNAIRYASPQQADPFVKVMIKIKPECAEISVRDNGMGIAAEHHSKIFDMFYRASDTLSGSGLGLYIVKETLEKLNGTVHIQSATRKGTEFFLTIPNLHQ